MRDAQRKARAGSVHGAASRLASPLAALVLAAHVGQAGEVPEPLFWGSEAEFLAQVEDGQFDSHLELHLLQYAADPGWSAEWAAQRFAGNGIFGEYGSTTARQLFVNSQIAVNLFPARWLQVRYDRRDYQDGRFDVSDQRFDAVFFPAAGWGVVLTGWPTPGKEDVSGGLGLRVGAARSRSSLELRVVDERLIWNEKSEGDVRFTSQPVRLLADGSLERGPFRVHGSVDYGLEYVAEEPSAAGATAGRSTRGFQRFGDLAAEWRRGEWVVAARLTGASLRRRQAEGTGGVTSLDRSWGRGVVSARRDLGSWTVAASVGIARQRDEVESPAIREGRYRMDALVFGAEGARRLGKGLELRVGYLGSSHGAERTAASPGPLPDRDEHAYVDKAHLRALYSFGPKMCVELLVSQTVSGSRFGGGSVKALLVF